MPKLRFFSDTFLRVLASGMIEIPHCPCPNAYFLRMDLYDAGSYFSVDVPVQSLSRPLLKAAVCAYAAKHMSRLNVKSKIDPSSLQPTTTTTKSHHKDQAEWAVLGAQYYTTAINLLREGLNEPRGLAASGDPSSPEYGASKKLPSHASIKQRQQ